MPHGRVRPRAELRQRRMSPKAAVVVGETEVAGITSLENSVGGFNKNPMWGKKRPTEIAICEGFVELRYAKLGNKVQI